MSELAQGFSDGHSINGSQETSCIYRKGFLLFLSYGTDRGSKGSRSSRGSNSSYPFNPWWRRLRGKIKVSSVSQTSNRNHINPIFPLIGILPYTNNHSHERGRWRFICIDIFCQRNHAHCTLFYILLSTKFDFK